MNIDKIIAKRRSTRRFKRNVITKRSILQILNSARLAPSAKNRQPWKFLVCDDNTRLKCADIMEAWQDSHPERMTSISPTVRAMRQAPVLILCFKDSDDEFYRSDTLSIGAAIENMLLKATSLNIDSLFICDITYPDQEISKLCNTDLELFAGIALGISDEQPCKKALKTMDEIVTFL